VASSFIPFQGYSKAGPSGAGFLLCQILLILELIFWGKLKPGVSKRQNPDRLGTSESNFSKLACPDAATKNLKLTEIIGN